MRHLEATCEFGNDDPANWLNDAACPECFLPRIIEAAGESPPDYALQGDQFVTAFGLTTGDLPHE